MIKKILLVDDKYEFSTLLSAILSSKYEVELAKNGLEALAILQRGYFPDVILSDLMMPEIDGIVLLEQLKASEIFKHIPVIIISSIEHSVKKTQLIKSGADDYIEKPFNPAELEARIERVLIITDNQHKA